MRLQGGGALKGARVSDRSGVAMMQDTDLRDGDHTTPGGRLWLSAERRVPVQRQVGSTVVVIDDVVLEDASQVLIIENDQMVEALAPDRPDDSLSVWVLPG